MCALISKYVAPPSNANVPTPTPPSHPSENFSIKPCYLIFCVYVFRVWVRKTVPWCLQKHRQSICQSSILILQRNPLRWKMMTITVWTPPRVRLWVLWTVLASKTPPLPVKGNNHQLLSCEDSLLVMEIHFLHSSFQKIRFWTWWVKSLVSNGPLSTWTCWKTFWWHFTTCWRNWRSKMLVCAWYIYVHVLVCGACVCERLVPQIFISPFSPSLEPTIIFWYIISTEWSFFCCCCLHVSYDCLFGRTGTSKGPSFLSDLLGDSSNRYLSTNIIHLVGLTADSVVSLNGGLRHLLAHSSDRAANRKVSLIITLNSFH